MRPASDIRNYRHFHDAVVPGVEGLHRMMHAIFDTVLPDEARILISGAGGGRELETLGASAKRYQLVGVDPSAEMLDLARSCVSGTDVETRTTLITGVPADLPAEPHDAATSLFVMHFLRDDGAKASYLHDIRERLTLGAPYLHVDVCYEGLAAYEQLALVLQGTCADRRIGIVRSLSGGRARSCHAHYFREPLAEASAAGWVPLGCTLLPGPLVHRSLAGGRIAGCWRELVNVRYGWNADT